MGKTYINQQQHDRALSCLLSIAVGVLSGYKVFALKQYFIGVI